MDARSRRERFELLGDEPDLARRRLIALALVADRLADDGIEPILVGGAALELYTAGGYATGDVDLALHPAESAELERLIEEAEK